LNRVDERRTAAWALALASVASFMVALDALVVTTALSTIRTSLGASIEALEWTVNAYNLSFAVLLMTGAALGDRFGRRRMYVAGIWLFVAASAACALAPNIGWLIAARAVQGAGGALIMPLALAILSAAIPPERRAKALGIFSGVTGLALIVGPLIGGAIAQGIAWEWIFWLNVPIGVLVIPFVVRRVEESHGDGSAIDVGGLMLVTVSALGVIWGLMRGNGAGWGSLEVLVSLAAGVLLAVAFVAWESRAATPMIPPRLFRSGAFAAGNGAAFLYTGAIYGGLFFLPQFLQVVQGYSPLGAGLRLLPWTAVLFVVAPIAGGLVNRVGERPLVVIGLLLQAIGMAWLGLAAGPDAPYVGLVPPLIVAGAGVSLAMPAAQNAVMSAVARSEIGKASGTFNTVRYLGGAFGLAVAAAVFAAAGGFAPTEGLSPAQAFGAGFGPAVGVSAGLSLLAALAGLGLPGRRAPAPVRASSQAA
jgi:EmrB/QacA subfamily drug resistance transporter